MEGNVAMPHIYSFELCPQRTTHLYKETQGHSDREERVNKILARATQF